MMEQKKKLYLLDAYALIFRAYYAMIRTPRINSKGLNTSAILGFTNTLEEVLTKTNPEYIAVAFDPAGPTFRHDAYPAYKAHRDATPEDIKKAVPYIKELLAAYNIPVYEVAGYEADDVIGTLAKQAEKMGLTTYMMTPDKDYAQLVSDNIYMYKPSNGGKPAEIMGIPEVLEKFGVERTEQVIDILGLQGDAADNIPGCPGIGPKTATKLIEQFGSIESLLDNTAQLKGAQKQKIEENKAQITESKWLVTIKTDVPVSLDLKEVARKEADESKLEPLFKELEFVTMMRRRQVRQTEENQPQAPIQLDLFGNPVYQTNTSSVKIETPINNSKLTNEEPTKAEGPLATIESRKPNYRMLTTDKEISAYVATIKKQDVFCIDTETTHIEPMRASLVGISLSYQEKEAVYIAVSENKDEAIKQVALLAPILSDKKIGKIGQNIKYDMIVLSRYGAKFEGPLWDTMIAHYLLQPDARHNMDFLAESLLHYQPIPIEKLIGPKGKKQKNMRDIPQEDIVDYACEDADITLALYHHLLPLIELDEDTKKLFNDIEMPLVRVLADMEQTGVYIDTDILAETATELTARLAEIEKSICSYVDTPFNISSPKQVGEVLFETLKLSDKPKKTKTGQYVTSEETLEKLRDKHKIVGEILDYRGLKKLLSTYVEALPDLINPETGRIHTSFNQAVAATGRLSSSNPNLQNIPIRDADGKQLRKAFIPHPGHIFFSADYSQVELRLMAHLSQDEHLIRAFQDGLDIHRDTASKLYNVMPMFVDEDMRRKAKTANFGIIYGISAFGLSERMQVSRKEAKELIDTYFKTYPKVASYMENMKEKAREEGCVYTLLHRKRTLPDINSRNAVVRGYAERNAINAPIQGTAADIIKLAMIAINKEFKAKKLESKMILQVHDELNFSVAPKEKEMVEKIVLKCMEHALELSVPLIAESGWGKNWLEAH